MVSDRLCQRRSPVESHVSKTIRIGYTILVNEEGGAFLLSNQAKELAGDEYFENPMDYHQIVIPRIPSRLWFLDGSIETTIEDISIQTERNSATKPLMTRFFQHQVETDPITAIIAVSREPHYAMQLCGSSDLSRPTRSKRKPLHCTHPLLPSP